TTRSQGGARGAGNAGGGAGARAGAGAEGGADGGGEGGGGQGSVGGLGLGLGDGSKQAVHVAQDANPTPVLWVKLDPQSEWLAHIVFRKPMQQWVEQLFGDESVEAQCHALRGLVELPLPQNRNRAQREGLASLPCQALAEAVRGKVAHTQVEHAACVRAEAAVSLAMWQNAHAPPQSGGFGETEEARAASWEGLYQLLGAFSERFQQRIPVDGGRAEIVLFPNWFDDPTEYRLKKALLWAIGNVRAKDGCTPQESVYLLVMALSNNDNAENTTTDDYYVAQLLTALGQTSTSTEAGLARSTVLEAIAQARRWLDLDILGIADGRGSHNGVVAACALQCLCELEMLRGGVPEVDYFSFTLPYYPVSIRVAACQSVTRLYLAEDMGSKEGKLRNVQ
ncbi:unnamed protein product, partial [Discosporangium mesarthrocarpum]